MAGNKRIPWSERAAAIKAQYPMSDNLDWNSVFTEDPAILGGIINDILKLDQSRSGKPGKRPSLAEDSTVEKMKKLQDVDYTDRPFVDAFRDLCGERSVRAVASKTGLDKSFIHRLMNGNAVPNDETISVIARSFDKHPSYFVEHRVNSITSYIADQLIAQPESSIVFYKKISGRK